MKNLIIVSHQPMGCTIIEIANQVKKYNTIAIDLVAMCLNDYLSKKMSMRSFSFKNTWNNTNQKLISVINEN